MPIRFERMGIAFQYPENWTLDEADAPEGGSSVTISSPGGGFWSVAVHPRSAEPTQLARAAVDAMKQEYREIEVATALQEVADRELAGFDLFFYYLDLTNTAQVRCFRDQRASYTVFCQAEDREFEQVRLVFDAMTTSLLTELGGSAP